LQRLVRGLSELKDTVPGIQPLVVVNRVRSTGVPGDAGKEIRGALARYAGVEEVVLVPLDVAGVDAAVAAGRTLVEASPQSPTRAALAALAADLIGVPRAHRRRRLRRGAAG
jgi:Flp pilus assembly CpaE family ATPase